MEPAALTKGHERTDAKANLIFGLIALLLAAGVAIHFILFAMWEQLRTAPLPAGNSNPSRRASNNLPQGPQLQTQPQLDYAEFRKREETELHSYGWVNRTQGIARIPIERAFDLLLAEVSSGGSTTNQLGSTKAELLQQRAGHRAGGRKGTP